MAIKVNGQTVVNNDRKGTFEVANPGQFTTVERDALTPVVGDMIFNTDEENLEIWDGTEWKGAGGGVINGVDVIQKPSVTTPSDGSTDIQTTATWYSSAPVYLIDGTLPQSAHWEYSSDQTFTSIQEATKVITGSTQSLSEEERPNIDIAPLQSGFVRVRYSTLINQGTEDEATVYSPYSDVNQFTTTYKTPEWRSTGAEWVGMYPYSWRFYDASGQAYVKDNLTTEQYMRLLYQQPYWVDMSQTQNYPCTTGDPKRGWYKSTYGSESNPVPYYNAWEIEFLDCKDMIFSMNGWFASNAGGSITATLGSYKGEVIWGPDDNPDNISDNDVVSVIGSGTQQLNDYGNPNAQLQGMFTFKYLIKTNGYIKWRFHPYISSGDPASCYAYYMGAGMYDFYDESKKYNSTEWNPNSLKPN